MGPDDLLCSVPPSPAVEVQEDIQRETENDRERQRGIIQEGPHKLLVVLDDAGDVAVEEDSEKKKERDIEINWDNT